MKSKAELVARIMELHSLLGTDTSTAPIKIKNMGELLREVGSLEKALAAKPAPIAIQAPAYEPEVTASQVIEQQPAPTTQDTDTALHQPGFYSNQFDLGSFTSLFFNS